MEQVYILRDWPRWRVQNAWKGYGNSSGDRLRGFCLFSFWISTQFIGMTLCNIAIEYNRYAE